MQSTLNEVRKHIDDTSALIDRLTADRADLKKALGATGYTTFEQVRADEKAYGKLRELADVERLLGKAAERLATLQDNADRLDSALHRLERLAQAQSATGEKVDSAEIAAIMEDARRQEPEQGPATVEEHVQEEQLKQMFDTEVAGR